jgi:hypothetical protein
MDKRASVFIVSEDGDFHEIKGGLNMSKDDGKTYRISEDKTMLYRFNDDGDIDAEFKTFVSTDQI